MLSNLTDLADSAVQPSIAMSGSNVVVIYRQSGSTGTALSYQAGSIGNTGILSLGSKTGVPQKGNTGNTDNGETPTIAINSQGVVVEIHESNGSSSELWTHVGQHNGTAITWGDSQDSIQTLASWADACLGQGIQTLIQQGHITSTYLPNLIYVDFCDNFVTDVCNFIHATLYNE